MDISADFLLSIVKVAWINILLSGDNAVVIGLACRSLPDQLRRWGILLGSGAAIGLRIVFAFMVTWLLTVPYLQAAGGALLLWIAVSLTNGEGATHNVKAHDSLWRAVGTIAVADMAMSLDNVLAIAAVARGNHWLFIFGLALSIPLIVAGAAAITALLAKLPVLVWAGAAILGWVAGEMVGDDPALLLQLGLEHTGAVHYGSAMLGGAAVVLAGLWLKRRNRGISQA